MRSFLLYVLFALISFGNTACGQESTIGPVGGNPIVVDVSLLPDQERQTIHSFGAADAWSAQFVGANWPAEKKAHVADLLFSTELKADGSPVGAGLSGWRYGVGAGSAEQGQESGIRDEWRRAESFLTVQGTYDWSKQAGERWFLQAARERGVREFIAFLNSPPVALTPNGKAYGPGGDKGNLAPEAYDRFATYLKEVLVHFREQEGIQFAYLSPFNEPQWDWAQSNGQEGSPWQNSEMAAIVRRLSPMLASAGLDTRIQLSEAAQLNFMYEEGGKPGRSNQVAAFFDSHSSDYVGNLPNVARNITGHSYFTTADIDRLLSVRRNVAERVRQVDPGLEFWQSEFCILEKSNDLPEGGSRRDLGIRTALYTARVIHTDLTVANSAAWYWWLAISPYDYKDGLLFIDRDKNDGQVYESKLLWALGHYARFIRPGAKRIDIRRSDDNNPRPFASDVLVSAFKNTDGSLVVVLVNQQNTEASISLNAGAKRTFRRYQTTDAAGENMKHLGDGNTKDRLALPPRSLTTVVFP